MDPVSQLEEPDHMDRFQCSYCGHRVTIAPLMISITQMVSCVLGALVTGMLLFRHLASAVQTFQLDRTGEIMSDVGLILLALFFLGGFGYTFVRALHNLRVQMRYRHVRKPA
jgi:hypothetical protein